MGLELLEAPGGKVRGQAAHPIGVAPVLVEDRDREVLAGGHAGIDSHGSCACRPRPDRQPCAAAGLGSYVLSAAATVRDVARLGWIEVGEEALDGYRGILARLRLPGDPQADDGEGNEAGDHQAHEQEAFRAAGHD